MYPLGLVGLNKEESLHALSQVGTKITGTGYLSKQISVDTPESYKFIIVVLVCSY